jgi:nitroreductase
MSEYLNWRYATQKFDPVRKIPEAEFLELLESLRLAPSSYGLQPWKFVVVRDETIREKLRKHAWNQPQVTDASHLLVLCALKGINPGYVKNFTARIAKSRGVALESLSGYEQAMLNSLKTMPAQALSDWMKRQVYLALGMLLAQCAHKKIDSCPMEGFDAKKFDEILRLKKLDLGSVVLCPIGYRAKDDQYAGLKKVRFTKSEVFIEK